MKNITPLYKSDVYNVLSKIRIDLLYLAGKGAGQG